MKADFVKKAYSRSAELMLQLQQFEQQRGDAGITLFKVNDFATRAANLVHSVTGSRSVYAEGLRCALKHKTPLEQYFALAGVVQAFHLDLTGGNLDNLRQKIEGEVITDLLQQARRIAAAKGTTPSAVVLLACSAAEEFLRHWCEEQSIKVTEKQRNLARFGKALREAQVISVTQEKRIENWFGFRNDAIKGDKEGRLTLDIATHLMQEVEDLVLEQRDIIS